MEEDKDIIQCLKISNTSGGEFCGKEFESSKSKCGSIHEEEG